MQYQHYVEACTPQHGHRLAATRQPGGMSLMLMSVSRQQNKQMNRESLAANTRGGDAAAGYDIRLDY